MIMKYFFNMFAALSFLMLTACGEQGFTEEDITNMKQSIKTEFEKNDEFKVTEVDLIIESPKKVSGLVKISISGNDPIIKDCSATMGQDRRYIWKCQ